MNKPKVITNCWECGAFIRITRKRLAQVGNYPKCKKHEANFLAYVGNLYRIQN
jgi:hypothetical protein